MLASSGRLPPMCHALLLHPSIWFIRQPVYVCWLCNTGWQIHLSNITAILNQSRQYYTSCQQYFYLILNLNMSLYPHRWIHTQPKLRRLSALFSCSRCGISLHDASLLSVVDLLFLVGGGGDGAVRVYYHTGTANHSHQQEETEQEDEEQSKTEIDVHLQLERGSSLVHFPVDGGAGSSAVRMCDSLAPRPPLRS